MPSQQELMARLESEVQSCYAWSNGPHFRYEAHTHPYEKVLYCVSGSITFVLDDGGRRLELGPGDRMVLARGTVHSAVVGASGVTCIEGRREPAKGTAKAR